MPKLLYFFAQGLIIMFLVILGLYLLERMKKFLTWLFTCWIILVIFTVLILHLAVIVWGIIYLVGK